MFSELTSTHNLYLTFILLTMGLIFFCLLAFFFNDDASCLSNSGVKNFAYFGMIVVSVGILLLFVVALVKAFVNRDKTTPSVFVQGYQATRGAVTGAYTGAKSALTKGVDKARTGASELLIHSGEVLAPTSTASTIEPTGPSAPAETTLFSDGQPLTQDLQ